MKVIAVDGWGGTGFKPGAMSVPAKVLRPLSDAQQERVQRGYLTYVGLKELYRARA